MGTRYRVRYVTRSELDEEALRASVQAAVDLVDEQMSNWKPESPVSRFNRAAPGEWFTVPPELALVVEAGQGISRSSRGAFDMTLGAAVNRWGFGPDGPRTTPPDAPAAAPPPAAGGSAALLEIRRQPPGLRKTAPLGLDLCGIAKGYGVDRVAQCLEAAGVRDYLVAIDGEIRVRGRKPGLEGQWTVGLEAPTPGKHELWDVLLPHDGAIATSGDYRHFFDHAGRRYSHTIDARSGCPVENGVASVTVVRPDCMSADAWATALLVLGPHDGPALADARRIAALFLIRGADGLREIMTGGFSEIAGDR